MAINSRVAQRRLGALLRTYREAAGQNLQDVAEVLGWSKAKVSRIELAKNGITQRDLYVLSELYGVPQGLRGELKDLAQRGRRDKWWLAYNDFLSPAYADQIGWEDEAIRMIEYQPLVIPGLVQTREYASSVTTGGALVQDLDRAEALVDIRLKRQERLIEDEPLELTAILTEAALMFQFCGTRVLRDQLLKLVERSQQANVEIVVIPFDAARRGAFAGGLVQYYFQEESSPTIAFLDTVGTSLVRDDEVDLRRITRVFDHLKAAALPAGKSVDLIARRAEALK